MSDHLEYEINKELGECYLFMGDLDKAEEYYCKAASSNGVHPDPYMGLATIAVQRGDLPVALNHYNKAASIGPNDKAEAGIGLIAMENGQHDEAFARFDKALTLNPENMVAVFGIIQAGYVLNRLADVTPHLENFLAVNPLKTDVRFALAGCLTTLGRTADAGRHLEVIMAREPGNSAARELYEHLALAS
ncbi:tetratricopeptide repeat protein [Megalodesulfovibrio paquesii]